jgi:hypothetical protein
MTAKRPEVQRCGERHAHYLHCLVCNPPPAERPGMKVITVKGMDAGDALVEAALHLEGRGYRITGEPVKTSTFVDRWGPKVWLWKVPVEHEGLTPPPVAAEYRKCPECGRIFNVMNPVEAQEWYYGHDCEVQEED